MALRDLLVAAKRQTEEMPPYLSLTESSSRHAHLPILFENVSTETKHPVMMNLVTPKVLAGWLETTQLDLIRSIGDAVKNPVEPKIVEDSMDALVLGVTRSWVDLSALPIPTYYPEDAGPYLTSAIIIVEEDGIRNTSFHRMLVKSKDELVVRLVPRHLHRIVSKNRDKGEETPIAIVMGADPFTLISAAISFDFGEDELAVSSALKMNYHGEPLELVRLANGVSVPTDAEYVMEGCVTLEDGEEGPFVDITGTLDGVRMQPIIRIDAIHHRTEPIFHGLIPAQDEHRTLMGFPRLPIILLAIEEVCEVSDISLSEGGSGWLSLKVAVGRITTEQSRAVIDACFKAHPSLKQVIVVNDDIDIHSAEEIEWALMTRTQASRDMIIVEHQKGSSLDPSLHEDGTTDKIGIDATIPPELDFSLFKRYA